VRPQVLITGAGEVAAYLGRVVCVVVLLGVGVISAGCTTPYVFPEPGAWGELSGPGGPSVAFEESELMNPCAYLDGGPEDDDHHNMVGMYDGYLLMPWAPEWSGGGLSFFEFEDPCAPVKVGEMFDGDIRETHNLGAVARDERVLAAFDYHGGLIEGNIVGGIQIWDITNAAAPFVLSSLALPGYVYPDAYARVSLAAFWQGDLIWVSGCDNGFWVVDASDPSAPHLAYQYSFDPPMRVGAVHLIGDIAMVSGAEIARTVLLDVSDPMSPTPFPGGEFETEDAEGEARDYYFANTGGRYALFARKESGGGFIAYDISDPRAPQWAGDSSPSDGSGGYVFRQHQHLFVGESNFAAVYDFSDPQNASEVARGDLEGDLDTATPIGNVLVLSVDDDAAPDQASAVVAWANEPDTQAPTLELHRPAAEAVWVAPTVSIGLSFDEMVEFKSVFEGSLRVRDEKGQKVEGLFGVQENVVSFTPVAPLLEDTTYTVTVAPGGIMDYNSNAVTEEVSFRFSTGGELR